MRDSFRVDLRTWIVGEHAGLDTRLAQAVAAHVPPARWRDRAQGDGSSIAHLLFHQAWHEDLALHTVVADRAPHLDAWREPLGLASRPHQDGLGEAEVPGLTAALDLEALVAYGNEVHRATQAWLAVVDLAALDEVPPASERMAAAGVTDEAVPWLHAMWRDKPVSFFVQWEAIGHRQGHLGEMISVRSRLGLSPF